MPSDQTTQRAPVPCNDVTTLLAYDAGRKDAIHEALCHAQTAAQTPDGLIYAGKTDTAEAALARVLARLERMAQDEEA